MMSNRQTDTHTHRPKYRNPCAPRLNQLLVSPTQTFQPNRLLSFSGSYKGKKESFCSRTSLHRWVSLALEVQVVSQLSNPYHIYKFISRIDSMSLKCREKLQEFARILVSALKWTLE